MPIGRRVSRLSLVALAALGLTGLAAAGCRSARPDATATAASWSYGGSTGPAHWAALFPRECAGREQSPVDLAGARYDATLPKLEFAYGAADLVFKNDGHTIKAVVPPGTGTLRFGTDPTPWRLDEIHFHGRSEHLFGAVDFPLEVHLVHRSPSGEVAAVGIFLIAGEGNEQLTKLWDQLPGEEGDRADVRGFDFSGLLPERRSSYRYPGSLTTPTCAQGLRWNVLAEPMTLTKAQIESYHDIFRGLCFPDGNRRPIQPPNGRVVVTDVRN